MEEIWKNIEGHDGYEISNLGRVKSLPKPFHHFQSNKTIYKKERINTVHINPYGYYQISIRKNRALKAYMLHRLIANAFIPNPNNLPQVNHKDGNKLNNSIENLEWCTQRENMQHAYRTGLKDNRGEKSGVAKLTEVQVLEIRAKYRRWKYTCKMLGKEYGVNDSHIACIITRRSWKHI